MNLKKLFFPLLLLTSICFLTSCDKEGDDDYLVAIDILAPTENTDINANEAFTVEVEIARAGDIIHNVAIMIVDSAGNHVQKLEDRHVHDSAQYTFKKEDVVITEAGTYRLMVVSTDMHDGEHEEEGHDHDEEDHDDDDDENIEIRTFEVN